MKRTLTATVDGQTFTTTTARKAIITHGVIATSRDGGQRGFLSTNTSLALAEKSAAQGVRMGLGDVRVVTVTDPAA